MKKKLNKGNIIIICIISFFVIITIGVIIFLTSFIKDKEQSEKIVKNIKKEYQVFSESSNNFSKERAEFYSLVNEYFLLEEVNANMDTITTFINEYETLITTINDDSSYLLEYCEYKYADYSAENRCNLFKQGYEAIMNYYLTDINVYNNFVNTYDNYLNENELEYDKLNLIDLKYYKEYIDYDNDGYYLGGE